MGKNSYGWLCIAVLCSLAAVSVSQIVSLSAPARPALNYRQDLALREIISATSRMTGVFFNATDPNSRGYHPRRDSVDEDYYRAIDDVRNAVNESVILFGSKFDEDLSRYLQIHRSLRNLGVGDCRPYVVRKNPSPAEEYRQFAAALTDQFDDLCKSLLETGSVDKAKRMTLKPIPFELRDKMTPREYLDTQMEFFKASSRKE